MEYEVVSLKEKTVVGLIARTNNGSPDMGRVIGGLWGQFYGTGVYSGIQNKRSGKALGIYTDYEGDETGDYSFMAACEVEDGCGGENGCEAEDAGKPVDAAGLKDAGASRDSKKLKGDGETDRAGETERERETDREGNLPSGAVKRVIPGGKYAKFVVRGELHQAVMEFWKELWGMDLPRNFVCDFEEYQDGNVENTEIHIYIGVK